MSQKIIDAVSEIIGQPFIKAGNQPTKLRKGHTVQGVIDSLPAQFADLQVEVAKSFPTLTPEDIPLHLVATELALNAATKGFGGSPHTYTKGLSWPAHVEIGKIIERKQSGDGYAQAQKDMVMSLYRDGLGREGEPKGVKDHLNELQAGRSFYAKALDVYWSPEAVALRSP